MKVLLGGTPAEATDLWRGLRLGAANDLARLPDIFRSINYGIRIDDKVQKMWFLPDEGLIS